MIRMLKVLGLLALTTLCVPAFAANAARPGTVNYVEGMVYLQGGAANGWPSNRQMLNQQAVGKTELNPGESLSTGHGKAEILLTPGIFLRLDNDSSIKMISPDLTLTQVSLDRGRVMVEVDVIYRQNNVQVIMGGVPTQLLKTGLYEFNANTNMAMVFSGRAAARAGESKWIVIKGHHELALNAEGLQKPQSFKARAQQGDLYDWSSLRSQYLSQANAELAQQYGWGAGYMPGWYWDPYFYGYTFLGMDPFFSPFGWGFYPFGWGGGFYGGYGYRGRYGYRGGYAGHGGYADHGGYAGHGASGVRDGGGNFRGSGGGFSGGGGFHGGGGFSGGGGGFHGGGGGGGGHR